jgi:hypothetical protein
MPIAPVQKVSGAPSFEKQMAPLSHPILVAGTDRDKTDDSDLIIRYA